MPRRSNAFQRVVRLIHEQISGPDAVVRESRMLTDRLTGDDVEVDVTIDSKAPPYATLISLECVHRETKGGRRATVEWVREMHDKHVHLPTDVLVLVSELGFTKGAERRAAKLGIRTMSFAAAARLDWAAEVEKINRTLLARLDVSFRGVATLDDGTVVASGEAQVINAAGERVGSLTRVIDALVHHPVNRERLWSRIPGDGTGTARLGYDARTEGAETWYVETSDGPRRIAEVVAEVSFTRSTAPVDLQHAAFDNRLVTHGEAELGKSRAAIAFVEDAEQRASARLLVTDKDAGTEDVVVMTKIVSPSE